METNSRLVNLRLKLKDTGMDAILISQSENRRYLSGFTGSAGYLIVTLKAQVLATDFRYVEQVMLQSPGFDLRQIGGEISSWFPKAVDGLGLKELAFEADDISYSQYDKFNESADTLGIKLIPANGLVENLRAIKEPGEVELIKKAISLSDDAIAYAISILHPGLTELELGWEIERFMREHGSEALPFEVIVASGPNAALPHAHPSEKPISDGEPVVVDIGARVGGYVSDLTRTLCAGRPDQQFRKIYAIVLRAQTAAEEKTLSGTSGHEADGFARQIIESAGYSERFGHGLGHGLGLVAHEMPRLGPNSKDILANNMVFTVEPGIYLPGWGGVRIEDTVIMENGKINVLSGAPK